MLPLDLLKPYNDNFDFDELGRLAIDYSDGIIQKSDKEVNSDLLKYATEKKEHHTIIARKVFADAIEGFYDLIAPDAEAGRTRRLKKIQDRQ